MSCFAKQHSPARQHIAHRIEWHSRETLQGAFGVPNGVERTRRLMFREAFAIGVVCVLLLQVGAIWQENPAKLFRGVGCVERTGIAIADQRRQIAGMVQMSVGQDHGVDRSRAYWEGRPIAQPQLFAAIAWRWSDRGDTPSAAGSFGESGPRGFRRGRAVPRQNAFPSPDTSDRSSVRDHDGRPSLQITCRGGQIGDDRILAWRRCDAGACRRDP
jgi:hypothetical protein